MFCSVFSSGFVEGLAIKDIRVLAISGFEADIAAIKWAIKLHSGREQPKVSCIEMISMNAF